MNSDNGGRVTGVSYYGPDGSDYTIEAELVILAPFIYDNTRFGRKTMIPNRADMLDSVGSCAQPA